MAVSFTDVCSALAGVQELWADQRQPVVHANPDEVDMFSAQEDEQPEVQAPEAEQSEQRRMTLDP